MPMPRNCRHCINMTCGDHNYCCAFMETMDDGEISAGRDCRFFEFTPFDAVTLEPWEDRPTSSKKCNGQMRIEFD